MNDAHRTRGNNRDPRLQSKRERDVQVQEVRESEVDEAPPAFLRDRVLKGTKPTQRMADSRTESELSFKVEWI